MKISTRTDSYGFQSTGRLESGFGHTAFGVEMTKEGIESSNLGNHDRIRHGLFIEHKFFPLEGLVIGLGSSAMQYSDWGVEILAGCGSQHPDDQPYQWFRVHRQILSCSHLYGIVLQHACKYGRFGFKTRRRLDLRSGHPSNGKWAWSPSRFFLQGCSKCY